MRTIIRSFYLIIFVFIINAASHAEDLKTIAVAGFINLGDRADDSVNQVISKSLITFLGKVRGIKVTSFEVMEKITRESKFWESKTLNAEAVVDIGLKLAVKQVVAGTYTVNRKKNTIQITVCVYDPATAELKLKRDYSGDAGIDVFDTIDKLIRSISTELVGHQIVMGSLEIKISSERAYNVLINQIFKKTVSSSEGFKDTESADEPFDLSIVIPETGAEVYRETITLKDGENKIINYTPSGSAIVRTGAAGIKVYADDVPVGETGKKGELVVRNLKAGTNHTIRAEKDGKPFGGKSILVEEGKEYSVDFNKRSLFFSVHVLQGGLGGTLGVDYYFLDFLRASLYGGAAYIITNTTTFGGGVAAIADADVGLVALNFGDFKTVVTADAFCYFTSPFVISPALRLEVSWSMFFVEGGARYDLVNNQVDPLVGIGVRF